MTINSDTYLIKRVHYHEGELKLDILDAFFDLQTAQKELQIYARYFNLSMSTTLVDKNGYRYAGSMCDGLYIVKKLNRSTIHL
jgi:hypothetical protein